MSKKRSQEEVRRAIRIGDRRTQRRKKVARKLFLKRVGFWHEISKEGVTTAQVRYRSGRQRVKISMPAIFCLLKAREETLHFFARLEAIFDHPSTGIVLVDHTTLESISIEAALLLIAHFEKLTTYAPWLKLISTLKGMPTEAHDLLEGIGYFSYYEGGDPEPSILKETRTDYIAIKTGQGSDAEASGTLVESFLNSGFLDERNSKRLGKCLVECMDNVSHHAYSARQRKPLNKRWWMVGFCNKDSRELFFAILDLGIGMARSLHRRRREISVLETWFKERTEEELIETAFTRSFSSTKKRSRGLGLPGLRRIINEVGNGELRVFSHESECLMQPNKRTISNRHKIPLAGTLLTWKLAREAPETVRKHDVDDNANDQDLFTGLDPLSWGPLPKGWSKFGSGVPRNLP